MSGREDVGPERQIGRRVREAGGPDVPGADEEEAVGQAGEEAFTVGVPTKVKVEGKKRPEIQVVPVVLRYDEIKYTKNIIKV